MANHLGESDLRAHVHGLRNQVGIFAGGWAELEVGGMDVSSYVKERSVLLTVSGTDEKTGQRFDIEIAIPYSQASELAHRIEHRAGIVR